MDDAIKKVVDVVGSKAAIARHLGITKGAVSQWTIIPAEHVLEVEKLTGGRVTRYELRPDRYPIDQPNRTDQ